MLKKNGEDYPVSADETDGNFLKIGISPKKVSEGYEIKEEDGNIFID